MAESAHKALAAAGCPQSHLASVQAQADRAGVPHEQLAKLAGLGPVNWSLVGSFISLLGGNAPAIIEELLKLFDRPATPAPAAPTPPA